MAAAIAIAAGKPLVADAIYGLTDDELHKLYWTD
jgi:hypothetical protein